MPLDLALGGAASQGADALQELLRTRFAEALQRKQLADQEAARLEQTRQFNVTQDRLDREAAQKDALARFESLQGQLPEMAFQAHTPQGQPILSHTSQPITSDSTSQLIPGMGVQPVSRDVELPALTPNQPPARIRLKSREQAMQEAMQQSLMKPTTLNPGQKMIVPITGDVVAQGGPEPTTYQQKPVLINGAPDLVNFDPKTGKSFKNGQDVTAQVKPIPPAAQQVGPFDANQLQAAVELVLSHKLAPSQAVSMFGGFGAQASAFKREMTTAIHRADPTFDFESAESNFQFGKAPATQTTVRFLDNIQKTIPVLKPIIDEMKLKGVRLLNRATVATKSQFGDRSAAQFELARTIIADEFAKILQGGGTGAGTSDAKLNQALELMDKDMSPEQWDGVLQTAQEMLDLRRQTLTKGTYLETPTVPPEVLAAGPGIHTFANGQQWEVSADGKTAKRIK